LFYFDETFNNTKENNGMLGYEKFTFRINQLLQKIVNRVTVRVLVPAEMQDLEKDSEIYSRVRADSQAKTKPRVLRDV
jgi:hypothetical protein